MKIKEESTSIVLLGNWNKYILTPKWLGENIFSDEELRIDVAFNDVALPNRYASEKSKIMIIPTEHNVTIISLNFTEKCLQMMEDYALKLVEKLPKTPMRAFGVNFGYSEALDEKIIRMQKIFHITDTDKMNEIGFKVSKCSIQRKIDLDENVLNLRLAQTDRELELGFNFHCEATDAELMKEKIKGSVDRSRNVAEKIIREVYGLEPVYLERE